MLDSVISILRNYSDDISRYAIYSVVVFRVDVEDVTYLLSTSKGDFAVYETDYFISLEKSSEVLREVAESEGYRFIAIESVRGDSKEDIVYTTENGRYKYIVASVESKNKKKPPLNPLTYGN